MVRWQKRTLEELGKTAFNVHNEMMMRSKCIFVRTLSLEALKHTTGTVGSCEVKMLIILEDMAIDEEVNLKLWRAFCGMAEARTVNGGVNS